MNVDLLRSVMARKGHHRIADLAEVLEINRTTIYNKMEGRKSKGFSQNEIQKIKQCYELTQSEVFAIFFKEGKKYEKFV